MSREPASVTLIYHFFHPDDVISARLFADMAGDMAARGWNVTVLTSDRVCRDPSRKISPPREKYRGAEVIRTHRPGLDQSRPLHRLANAAWLFTAWSLRLLFLPRSSVYVVGSDPLFSQLLFPIIRLLKPGSKIVFWAHDLYPDAIQAMRPGRAMRLAARVASLLTGPCSRLAHLTAAIGPCMLDRLKARFPKNRFCVLTPWALDEPAENETSEPDSDAIEETFPGASLVLLYSGNLGRAHDFRPFLDLARSTAKLDPSIVFAFGCRGFRAKELEQAVLTQDKNVRLLGFAPENELRQRLASAHLHMISIRPEWSGIVVPSKFFGAMAAGRPVLYAGPKDSTIGRVIRELDLGLVLDPEKPEDTARELVRIAADPDILKRWRARAAQAYRDRYARKKLMHDWDRRLRELIAE